MPENKILKLLIVFFACLAIVACKKAAQANASGVSEVADPLAMEPELNILALDGRIESGKNSASLDWVTPFETATGCKVKAVLLDNNELFASNLEGKKFDLVIAADAFLPPDQFQKIDFSRLRSFDKIDKRFLSNPSVQNKLALPLHWKVIKPVPPSTELITEVESIHLFAKAENTNCAYAWMEWSISPRVQADIAAALDTIPVVPAACIGSDSLGDEACKTRMPETTVQTTTPEKPIPTP